MNTVSWNVFKSILKKNSLPETNKKIFLQPLSQKNKIYTRYLKKQVEIKQVEIFLMEQLPFF